MSERERAVSLPIFNPLSSNQERGAKVNRGEEGYGDVSSCGPGFFGENFRTNNLIFFLKKSVTISQLSLLFDINYEKYDRQNKIGTK